MISAPGIQNESISSDSGFASSGQVAFRQALETSRVTIGARTTLVSCSRVSLIKDRAAVPLPLGRPRPRFGGSGSPSVSWDRSDERKFGCFSGADRASISTVRGSALSEEVPPLAALSIGGGFPFSPDSGEGGVEDSPALAPAL